MMFLPIAAISIISLADPISWVAEGPNPSFQIHKEGGVIEVNGLRHMPNWLRSDREFEDVKLRFEYKLEQWAEAGVLLRAPRTARPQRAGVTVVLAHDYHPGKSSYATGALLGVAEPLKLLPPTYGVWHAAEIELRGRRLRVKIDGEQVQDVEVPDYCLRRGYLGFPDMGYGYAVRNVEADDLGSPTKLVSLLTAGNKLEDWDQRDKGGTWGLDGDVITGANGSSILYAPGAYANFELTAAVRSHSHVNSGIFLRGQPTGANRGFEVQIFSSVDSIYPTGSIYNIERSRVSDEYEEKWFLMQIRVEGSRCRVWLDGELVAETDRLPDAVLKPGRIGLQIHKDGASVEFRDLRVRVLP